MQLLKKQNEIEIIEIKSIKTCPWCGCIAVLKTEDLGKPNGRGYPGHTLVYVQCANSKCRATAPNGKIDDIHRSTREAIDQAVKIWNTRDGE